MMVKQAGTGNVGVPFLRLPVPSGLKDMPKGTPPFVGPVSHIILTPD